MKNFTNTDTPKHYLKSHVFFSSFLLVLLSFLFFASTSCFATTTQINKNKDFQTTNNQTINHKTVKTNQLRKIELLQNSPFVNAGLWKYYIYSKTIFLKNNKPTQKSQSSNQSFNLCRKQENINLNHSILPKLNHNDGTTICGIPEWEKIKSNKETQYWQYQHTCNTSIGNFSMTNSFFVNFEITNHDSYKEYGFIEQILNKTETNKNEVKTIYNFNLTAQKISICK